MALKLTVMCERVTKHVSGSVDGYVNILKMCYRNGEELRFEEVVYKHRYGNLNVTYDETGVCR